MGDAISPDVSKTLKLVVSVARFGIRAGSAYNDRVNNKRPDGLVQLWRLGAVSFLNAKPLLSGLENDPAVELLLDVPARLGYLLDEGVVDAALVPVIDLAQPHRRWRILSDACIGCDGETLTVRVFSRGPAAEIRRLFVDGDSHTSVALADCLWRELHNRRLEILPLADADSVGDPDGILLIGDKVVTRRLIGFDVETDLGQSWKSLTGLPFVFAVWSAPQNGHDLQSLAARLSTARDAGVKAAEMIAADYGPGMGWPVNLARRYLSQRLRYQLGPRYRDAIAKFFAMCRRHGIVPEASEPVYA